ncbi:MAG: 23S rRNA (guanosine(2251)-2'-O)-methyltransferase RlmB, partial [Nitrospirae bacterium]
MIVSAPMAKRKRPHAYGNRMAAPWAATLAAMGSGRPQTGPREAQMSPHNSQGGGGPAYWIYGIHAALAALANPARRIRRLIVSAEAAESLAERLPKSGQSAEIMDRNSIDRTLPAGAVHQGIAVLAEPLPERDLDEMLGALAEVADATVLLLDQVTDPQNVGAV